ncbi:MAG: Arc family DNA-binding protein [Acidobacteriota bacterium]|nr:Arc family DNA-binding protein [Acidobacteriota bacterium]
MPDLLIKEIDEKVLEKLKALAERGGRSLQSELGIILKDAAERFEQSTDAVLARKIKDILRGRKHSDSAKLLREDRAR